MAKPLIPVEVIYSHALELLDAEGEQALNVRRVAADLKCSTRTLYQQVGNREQLIRALVARHFSQLKLEFHDCGAWESTARQWCLALHAALLAHPYLTELMTFDDRSAVASYVKDLLTSLMESGIARGLATECCRSLANTTINHAITEVQALRQPPQSRENSSGTPAGEESFRRTIQWIIAGVRQEALTAASSDPPASRDFGADAHHGDGLHL
ncbi:hypothetical protein OG874_35140 [Nocardia sp. NBC_00565]|uniref:TetR/AcrR family transcriptional regulator n=1 Tax=Nocardia sp. NBC_00565 TaxID=2975993 RepID=UPI002E800FF6|nr:hypothetical protein [Nocardia sp. NBC_00565]WUC01934.1 hypothetical protein OG874_35140 [Nocardia sp. NBC_00565]